MSCPYSGRNLGSEPNLNEGKEEERIDDDGADDVGDRAQRPRGITSYKHSHAHLLWGICELRIDEEETKI